MTSPVDLPQNVARSQACLRNALEEWNAADLQASERVCDLLRQGTAELDRARRGVAGVRAAVDAATTLRLRSIRDDAARLARLIESAASFNRGLAMQTGGAGDPAEAVCSDLGRA